VLRSKKYFSILTGVAIVALLCLVAFANSIWNREEGAFPIRIDKDRIIKEYSSNAERFERIAEYIKNTNKETYALKRRTKISSL